MLDRTKEPGALGEPLYLDVVTALHEAGRTRDLPFATMPQRGRRPLRAVVQGIHPGHGQGRLRRTWPSPSHATISPSASWMTSRTCRCRVDDDVRHRAGRRDAGGVLRPRRRRHGGRQQELHQDHRRGNGQLRPGLLRLRLEEIRGHDHLAPAFRPAADPFAPT